MIYIYQQHQGFDIYISPAEIPPEQLYCSHCDESDALVKITDDISELDHLLETNDAWSETKEEMRLRFLQLLNGQEKMERSAEM